MKYHTGTVGATRGTYAPTQYRGIEDLWGNVLDWIGSVQATNGRFQVDLRPGDGASGASAMCATGSGYIKSWGSMAAEGYEFALIPTEVVEDAAYVKDWFQGTAAVGGNVWGFAVFGGAATNKTSKAGLFQIKLLKNSTYSNVGFRFVRLPGYTG